MVSLKLAAVLAPALLANSVLATLPPIIVKGTKFFYQNGTQFYIKGVAYQQDVGAGGQTTGSSNYIDPLADTASCTRDIPLLKQLGANVIRTYAIDPTKNHDQCMSLLDAAGIYVISDLSSPVIGESIDRSNPTWDTQLFNRYKNVVDAMSKYSNTIGFFAGNEVTNNLNTTNASTFVKAAVRDMKAYIKNNKNRWLGVGYAADDDKDVRTDMSWFFNCGDQASAIDYFGLNIYEWCGQATFQSSGYQDRTNFYANYSVPVFFAEYGCNTVGGPDGRTWDDTAALYSSEMTNVWSGGIVYEYFQEVNTYGIVSLSGNTPSTMKNYGVLSSSLAAAHPASTSMSAYSPSNSPQPCPAVNANWESGNILPPTPNEDLCACQMSTLSCVPASNLQLSDYGLLFGQLCSYPGNPCAAISGNATTGVYGAFVMCNSTQKLGIAMDAYYRSQNSASSACSFGGKAQIVSPAGAAASCSQSLASASSVDQQAATQTQGTPSQSSSNFAAPMPMRTVLTLGDFAIGLYAVIAMIAGAAFFTL